MVSSRIKSSNYIRQINNKQKFFQCSEVLRLYPPATALIRECAQDYQLPGSDIIIDKGLQLVIPVCGINSDPSYYPYADSFNPENFSEEAKKSRSRYAFIPFGEGPRACTGNVHSFCMSHFANVHADLACS